MYNRLFVSLIFCILIDICTSLVDYTAIFYGTRGPYNISCENSSIININDVIVQKEGYSNPQCFLYDEDYKKVKCNSSTYCQFDIDPTCLINYQLVNLSYECKDQFDCSYYRGDLCGWTNSVDLPWDIRNGVLSMSSNGNSKQAQLISKPVVTNNIKCLQFTYYMDSNWLDANISLTVYQKTDVNNGSPVWKNGNIYLNKTNMVYVSLMPGEEIYQILVEGNTRKGDLKIDNIEVRDGFCNDTCDFETDWCDWMPLGNGTRWDRSFFLEKGNVAGVSTDNHGYGRLKYKTVLSNIKYCLSFWYYLTDTSSYDFLSIMVEYSEKIETVAVLNSYPQDKWIKNDINIYCKKECHLIIQAVFMPSEYMRSMLLDDLLLFKGVCNGVGLFKQSFLKSDQTIHIDNCLPYYVEENSIHIDLFLPYNQQYCTADDIEQVEQSIYNKCNMTTNWKMCEFKILDLSENKNCFILRTNITVEYNCTGPIDDSLTTLGSSGGEGDDSLTTLGSSGGEGDDSLTTLGSSGGEGDDSLTTLGSSGGEGDDSLTTLGSSGGEVIAGNLVQMNESNKIIGIAVGVGISLSGTVVLIIVFICVRKRSIRKKENSIKEKNNYDMSDYTGIKNIALPISNSDGGNLSSKHNRQSPYLLTKKEKCVSSILSQEPNTNNTDVCPGGRFNDITFAEVNPKNKQNCKTDQCYAILDPLETGLIRGRQQNDTSYDLAKPIEIRLAVESHDPYELTKDDAYDSSKNIRHKDNTNDIYSHAFDGIYDTSNHGRKIEENGDMYDHFLGQKTEDDYDISKRY